METNDGITIIPELAALNMRGKQQNQLRYFKSPAPVREISIATHRNQVKKRIIEALKEEILAAVPKGRHNSLYQYPAVTQKLDSLLAG